MSAYYNEIDPFAAQWLRNLIAAGHIAPGVVDERSIVEVDPCELVGFTQCHFFAGIGVWSYALRLAGWPDDREVWTGSCPCQPFSAAGKRGGVEDERHLWPEFFRLIRQCRPRAVFGEQVASKDGLAWLDIVSADLEGAGYACGAVDTCAAGFGAPHIRQRLYFVADSRLERRQQISPSASGDEEAHGREPHGDHVASGVSAARSLADSDGRNASTEGLQRSREHGFEQEDGGAGRELEHSESNGRLERRAEPSGRGAAGGCGEGRMVYANGGGRENEDALAARQQPDGMGPGATNGFWRDADWLPCIDGKARPVEPGTFPLAHGATARVGFVCAACLETSEEGQDDEDVLALPEVSISPQGRVATEVLQQGLHGRSVHQDAADERGGSVSGTAPVRRQAVRGLRQDGSIPASAPQGREPNEQCAVEHQDSLRELPREGTREDACILCGAEADWLAETALRGNRVGKLRAYGNAINARQAAGFIEAYLE